MLTHITNWVETQKKLKWRQALRIATQSPDRWTRNAVEWNPGLNISRRSQSKAGRPAKRCEDDLNEFVKDEETQATQSYDLRNNATWLTASKRSMIGKRKKNYTRSTFSTVEEPNSETVRAHLDGMVKRAMWSRRQDSDHVWGRAARRVTGGCWRHLPPRHSSPHSACLALVIVGQIEGTGKDALDILEINDTVGSCGLEMVWQNIDQARAQLTVEMFNEASESRD